MEKAIYWIDDNPGGIMSIVENIFPYFWKISEDEGIETHVRIFGNAEQNSYELCLWKKSDEIEFQDEIMKRFERLCSNKDEFGEEGIFNKKKCLIDKNIRFMYKFPENDEEEKEYENYKNIYNIWKNDLATENVEGEVCISKKARDLAKMLLEKMDIQQRACVGLDLALLQGDIKKVCDFKKPILSMELYNLLKANHECFLYSHYVLDTDFVNAWKEVYANYYDDEKIIIHKRSEMYAKNISESLIHELLEMVDESYAKGNM